MLTARNPDAARMPDLAVWEVKGHNPLGGTSHFVSCQFPNVAGFTCDSECYESPVDFLGARALPEGRIELRHRFQKYQQVILVTTVTPEPGAVEFRAQLELDNNRSGALPPVVDAPNLCCQFRRGVGFASKPDPYPEFIKRCFIFTARGRTFLDKTARQKLRNERPDAPHNNPPWVQLYGAEGEPAMAERAAGEGGVSPDRYTIPVIGVVSKDGKHLAALASDPAVPMSLSQWWIDCLHNNPNWHPAGAAPADRVWRVKIYLLENNAEALLERVKTDFPSAN
jgi:hypothetical protein